MRMKDIYKVYQKLSKASLDGRPDLIDLARPDEVNKHNFGAASITLLPAGLRETFAAFIASGQDKGVPIPLSPPKVYEVTAVPGKPAHSVTIHTLSE